MALVTIPGGVWMPQPTYFANSLPAYSSLLLDATTDRVAVVFRAPKAGNIRRIAFRTGTVPVKGGTTTLVFSLQDVVTGDPDDTDDQSATIANAAIVAATMIQSGNLSADRTVTLGETVAAVVKYGTFNTGDQVNIVALTCGNNARDPNQFSYVTANLTGAYAKQTFLPVFEIEYDDGSHATTSALAYPFSAIATDAYNNTSTPDEIGLLFQVPMPCRLAGCWLNIDLDGDINVNLYSASAKTTLGAFVATTRALTSASTGLLPFSTPAVLAANTNYVLAVEPSSATSVTLTNISVRAAVVLDQMAGGQAWQYATAKNPATTADFTATTTKRPVMGLYFDQMDDATSGGGSRGVKMLLGPQGVQVF